MAAELAVDDRDRAARHLRQCLGRVPKLLFRHRAVFLEGVVPEPRWLLGRLLGALCRLIRSRLLPILLGRPVLLLRCRLRARPSCLLCSPDERTRPDAALAFVAVEAVPQSA